MEYKITKTAWNNLYAVLFRSPGSGWAYVSKCLDKKAAEKLYKELAAIL